MSRTCICKISKRDVEQHLLIVTGSVVEVVVLKLEFTVLDNDDTYFY